MGVWKAFFCAVALATGSQLFAGEIVGTIRVIDGDTFDVGDTRIRLFGVDAPERDQTCVSPAGEVWACGGWVSAEVSAAYGGRLASCVPLDRDRYGRVVARCHVDGEDVARVLVQRGLVFAYRRYALDYDLDEKGAAIRGAGLHGNRVQAPAAYRADRAARAEAPARECAIKGNISARGVRIYHRPGQLDYDATRISPQKGERWFCTVEEAEAAGWRAARR